MAKSYFSDDCIDIHLRFERDDYRYLQNKGRGRTFNKALGVYIRLMREIEGEALAELRGYFTMGEWKFMADALKDLREPLTSKNELQRLVMMIQNMETSASYYGVVPTELCDKIANLSGVHVLTITERINEFWRHSSAVGMDEWARF